MFEKEAEEYRKDLKSKFFLSEPQLDLACQGFKDGYRKANEWHKVSDGDVPKENKIYLVKIKDNGLAIAYFNSRHWETRYNLGDFGHCVETVIAWCEIPTFEE